MTEINDVQAKSRKLISDGNISEALSLLEDFATKSRPEFYNEIVTLKNRLHTLKQGKRLNIISREVASVEDSKLTYNTLELISELNNEYPQTELLNNWVYFFGVAWSLVRKILSLSILLVSLIMFYFRWDIVQRLLSGKARVPFEVLFTPFFFLALGLIIFFHRKTTK